MTTTKKQVVVLEEDKTFDTFTVAIVKEDIVTVLTKNMLGTTNSVDIKLSDFKKLVKEIL